VVFWRGDARVADGNQHCSRSRAAAVHGRAGGAQLFSPWLFALWLLTGLAGALWAEPAAAQAPPGGCSLVFGHGRNGVAGADEANAAWDRVNQAFASAVTQTLSAQGQHAVAMVLPVTVTELAAIVPALLERAEQQGCTRIVEVTVFADDDELLIARLRAYPVLRSGSTSRIGEADYTHQQEYPNSQRNRDRLVPLALGQAFALAYLDRPPKPAQP
jgi:hypothetical protein